MSLNRHAAKADACPACAKAEADPRTGEFMLRCNECQTRQLAHGLLDDMPDDAYMWSLCRLACEGETLGEAHARVRRWAERIGP